MTDAEISAYAAGFIDGEGCVSIASAKGSLALCVQVTNTKREPLEFLRCHFAGTIIGPFERGLRAKPAFLWRIWSRKAYEALRRCQPYLIVKAEQARLAIEFQERIKNGDIMSRGAFRNDHKDAAIQAYRMDVKRKISELNKRGVN